MARVWQPPALMRVPAALPPIFKSWLPQGSLLAASSPALLFTPRPVASPLPDDSGIPVFYPRSLLRAPDLLPFKSFMSQRGGASRNPRSPGLRALYWGSLPPSASPREQSLRPPQPRYSNSGLTEGQRRAPSWKVVCMTPAASDLPHLAHLV